uniref:Putative septum site-determining protein MinD n=1 Tax=Microthamnion kuetzingianum TaxID=34148 RepID=A0A097KNA5_9CHLO|nr:septum site-determining protein [Microthamnion kuetzingianum]AIT94679.1 septum site-determining protein [Microthamnion kuetzingianum]
MSYSYKTSKTSIGKIFFYKKISNRFKNHTAFASSAKGWLTPYSKGFGFLEPKVLQVRDRVSYQGVSTFTEKNIFCSSKKAIKLCPRLQLKGASTATAATPLGKENEDDSLSNSQASRTIVITSGKGGVGKTTATANLGMSIARLGYRVALIDADIGLRNLDLLLGLENRILYTAMDILEGQCRLDQALIRDKRWKNLSLLSISKNRQRYNVTRKNMENLVKSISSLGYHFILIDCPAGIDVGFINAIAPAEEALIITTPEITAIRDADRVAGLLEANGIYNVKLLVNRVRPDMIQRNDMMSVRDVQEMLGIPLLGAIPEDNHVIISTNRGEPLVLKKKLTLSGIAFENAARRLIGKQDYFIDLASPYKGVFQKVQELFFGL